MRGGVFWGREGVEQFFGIVFLGVFFWKVAFYSFSYVFL